MDEKIVCEVTYNARDGKERKNPHEPRQEVLTVRPWSNLNKRSRSLARRVGFGKEYKDQRVPTNFQCS
jgi:hypothetical protein